MDMVQDGTLGLLRAIEKWDWRKGVKFSSYGIFWIRQSIRRGLGQARQIRLPAPVQELLAKVRRESTAFFVENSRSPTPEELAERLGISTERCAEIAGYLQSPVSLDAPVGNGLQAAGRTLLDRLETCEEDSPELTTEPLREQVDLLLGRLVPRHAFILRKRFGLDGEAPCTLSDVAALLGISAPRVREIETRALAKLRLAVSQPSTREALLEPLHVVEAAL
jgi:RNA polymerase primary sigma factor